MKNFGNNSNKKLTRAKRNNQNNMDLNRNFPRLYDTVNESEQGDELTGIVLLETKNIFNTF